MDDPMCSGTVPDVKYSPAVFGMGHLRRRSFNTTGNNFELVISHIKGPSYRYFLAHLAYQPKSLKQSCLVRRRHCCQHWHHCLCTPLLTTALDVATSNLV